MIRNNPSNENNALEFWFRNDAEKNKNAGDKSRNTAPVRAVKGVYKFLSKKYKTSNKKAPIKGQIIQGALIRNPKSRRNGCPGAGIEKNLPLLLTILNPSKNSGYA